MRESVALLVAAASAHVIGQALLADARGADATITAWSWILAGTFLLTMAAFAALISISTRWIVPFYGFLLIGYGVYVSRWLRGAMEARMAEEMVPALQIGTGVVILATANLTALWNHCAAMPFDASRLDPDVGTEDVKNPDDTHAPEEETMDQAARESGSAKPAIDARQEPMLRALDERLMQGEISEEVYLDLRARYAGTPRRDSPR